jgi:FkbH-like protein
MLERDIDEPKFSEIVKLVESLDNKDGDYIPLKIAFLRNITIDPIVPYVKYLCYIENIRASIHMGDYDNIVQNVMDTSSAMYRHSPDIIVICLKIETLAEELAVSFSSMSSEEINEEEKRVVSFVETVLSEIRKNTKAVILLHNIETPVYPSFGVLDYQDHFKQVNTIRKINNDLLDVIDKYDSSYIVDVDLLQSTLGYLSFIDSRYWHIGKAPYTKEACKIIAKEYIKFIRALKGKNKKCLVLDCDNTLWGGIIGEDGINKIKIGRIYPGSAYREFQQAILNLYNRGIMLAICSKNNESDVLEVLEKHPDMILREEHFVSMRINWNDKVANLKEIASELNIGLDSLGLVDDSDFEINLVKKMLPEVKIILLPKDPSLYRDVLNSSGLFDTLAFSEEDLKRNEMYRAEIRRRKVKTKFQSTTLEDYYKYLEMEVSIKIADEFSIPRISQLTQRTNQFNLTTKRYSESEIKELSQSKDADVFYLHLNDRFGESGIVGIAILKYFEKEAFIDTFLLSCRVIGRGIEDVFLKACINASIKRGCEKINGLYTSTKKNGLVEGFYKNRHFYCVEKNNNGAKYLFSLKEAYPDFHDYFKSIRIDDKEYLEV